MVVTLEGISIVVRPVQPLNTLLITLIPLGILTLVSFEQFIKGLPLIEVMVSARFTLFSSEHPVKRAGREVISGSIYTCSMRESLLNMLVVLISPQPKIYRFPLGYSS